MLPRKQGGKNLNALRVTTKTDLMSDLGHQTLTQGQQLGRRVRRRRVITRNQEHNTP